MLFSAENGCALSLLPPSILELLLGHTHYKKKLFSALKGSFGFRLCSYFLMLQKRGGSKN